MSVIVTLVVLFTLAFFFYQRINNASEILVKVGNTIITKKDVAYRLAVDREYGNGILTDATATQSLVDDATEQEVAKALGVFPEQADIKAFAEHVDSTTKAPELLAAVKNVFATDINSYERLYLLPKMVNIALHSAYSIDENINRDILSKIEKAYSEIISGASFEVTAKVNGLDYISSSAKNEDMNVPELLQGYFTKNDFQKPKLFEVLEKLKDGEVYHGIVEDKDFYQIIRLISSESGIYNFEAIIAKKQSYEDWYNMYAKKLTEFHASVNQ